MNSALEDGWKEYFRMLVVLRRNGLTKPERRFLENKLNKLARSNREKDSIINYYDPEDNQTVNNQKTIQQ